MSEREELAELNNQARLLIRRIQEKELGEAAVAAGIASPWEPPADRDDYEGAREEEG